MTVESFRAGSASPIGIFDSGLGGLTVVRSLLCALPAEPVLYVADQAHVPYGGRALHEVRGFALAICTALAAAGCKAIVMACNISSATALEEARRQHPGIPVLGVIEPGARAALAATRRGKVGVLATEGTVKSGAYSRTLQRLAPSISVTEVACPAFVPLVERGDLAATETLDAARRYLEPLRRADVDTVILGCTHYPFLAPALQRIAPDLHYVDPAAGTVAHLAAELGLPRAVPARPADVFRPILPILTTTGAPGAFALQLERFLPEQTHVLRGAAWCDGVLHIQIA